MARRKKKTKKAKDTELPPGMRFAPPDSPIFKGPWRVSIGASVGSIMSRQRHREKLLREQQEKRGAS